MHPVVVYIDTERDLSYQLPKVFRALLEGASIEPLMYDPENFQYTSLVNISRSDRLNAMRTYLTDLRQGTVKPLIIVLDVATDCVRSFNDEGESLEFVDFLNFLVNNTDSTVLAVIHENPGPGIGKARGHLGTELSNKASTTIRISDLGAGSNEIKIFKVDIIKNRYQGTLPPFFVKYDKGTELLASADAKEIETASTSRSKVSAEDVTELLPEFLAEPKTRRELLDFLIEKLGRKERILEELLKEIMLDKIPIHEEDDSTVFLSKSSTSPVMYSLIPALIEDLEYDCNL